MRPQLTRTRKNRHPLDVRSCDSFEMRADAAEFGVYKRVDELQVTVEPRKQAVLYLVMDGQRDFSAVRSDLCEIDQADYLDISAGGFECELVGRL